MATGIPEKCAHCQVEIRDQSTMVQRGGRSYCCNNCAMAMDGQSR